MTPDHARGPATAREPGVATQPIRRRAPFVPARGSTTGQGLDLTVEFLAAIGTYGLLGWLADGWLGTTPWCFTAGLLLGMICGLYLLALRARADDPAERRRAAAAPTDDVEDTA